MEDDRQNSGSGVNEQLHAKRRGGSTGGNLYSILSEFSIRVVETSDEAALQALDAAAFVEGDQRRHASAPDEIATGLAMRQILVVEEKTTSSVVGFLQYSKAN